MTTHCVTHSPSIVPTAVAVAAGLLKIAVVAAATAVVAVAAS